eukprot:694660-Hanusia_phi.AAC.1
MSGGVFDVRAGEVIIFVSTKVASEELSANLVKFNFRWTNRRLSNISHVGSRRAAALHGDKDQRQRDQIFSEFKKGLIQ